MEQATETAPWRVVGRGLTAGLAGTAAMTLLQTTVAARIPSGTPRRPPREPGEPQAKDENTTETTARRFVEGFAHRHLPAWLRPAAGYAVHFATGAALGALLALFVPRPKWWEGLAFGAAAWLVDDDFLVPLLKLGDWPNHYAFGTHAKSLSSHLAYGIGTALALDGVTALSEIATTE